MNCAYLLNCVSNWEHVSISFLNFISLETYLFAFITYGLITDITEIV